MKDPQRVLLYTYTGLAALVCVLSIAAILIIGNLKQDAETAQAPDSSVAESIEEVLMAQTPAIPHYTVKAWNGGIGVFDASGELIRTFSTSVSTLPQADQTALEKGIEVVGKEALDQLLQDLTS